LEFAIFAQFAEFTATSAGRSVDEAVPPILRILRITRRVWRRDGASFVVVAELRMGIEGAGPLRDGAGIAVDDRGVRSRAPMRPTA
jgi:hypothetical protein